MNIIRRCCSYLFRQELDVRHKLINIALIVSLLTQIPMFVVTVFFVTGTESIVVCVLAFLVTLACLYILNKFYNSDILKLCFCIFGNFIVFPILYCTCGGYLGGALVWLVCGAIYTLLLCKGRTAWVIFTINMLLDCALVILQIRIPGLVTGIPEGLEGTIDLVQCVILVGVILGVVIRYQTRLYEQQQLETLARDAELQEANAILRKADKAKSEFLSKMSHEIRTPINAIVGMDEMILRESREDNILTYASSIDSAGHTLLTLVNDILDLSRISAGRLELIEGEYELYPLLIDCYNMVWTTVQDKGLQLTFENDPEIPERLIGDSMRLKQCIVNLLTNAVKYTSHGSVSLKLEQEVRGDRDILLKVSVTDTGAGIAPEDIETLYESFRKLNDSESIGISGVGLGLPITKSLIDMMHGTINVKSSRGIGSTFTIEVPQRVADTEERIGSFSERYADYTGVASGYEASFTAPDAAVLIVDDIQMNLNVIKALLKHTLIKPDTAISGQEALALASAKHYDLIFLDHMMPGMDGVEVLQKLRDMKKSPSADSPVIVLTANAILGAKEQYIAKGFTDYIAKPVRSSELERLLVKYLPQELVRTAEGAQSAVRINAVMPVENSSGTDPHALWIKNNFDFLDVATGIANCADSSDVLIGVLQEMTRQTVTDSLENAYAMSDWKNYAIFVHAMKGTLRVIGYPELAERAFALEKASKAEDADTVRRDHAGFVGDYRHLLEIISGRMESKPF